MASCPTQLQPHGPGGTEKRGSYERYCHASNGARSQSILNDVDLSKKKYDVILGTYVQQ